MALMTSIYTGVSGLKASQIGINTTAHNISNTYTEGYVRQQVSFSDTNYADYGSSKTGKWKVGLGVVASDTQHIRDLLLDREYRLQAGRENYYSSQHETVEEIQDIFGELNNVAFQGTLKDLWNSLSEIAKDPNSSVNGAGLVMYAEEFLTNVNSIGDRLVEYQKTMNKEVSDIVNDINSLGDEINRLNEIIQGVEATGVESANDYRDDRDRALDKLSQLISITYNEDEFGVVSVRAEGEEFITKGGVFHMAVDTLDTANDSVYLTPVWPQLEGEKVFSLRSEVSSIKENDIGKLKALVQSRGGYAADYTSIPQVPEQPHEEDFLDGSGNLDPVAYNAAVKNYWTVTYPAFELEAIEYNKTIGSSMVMKTQAMFDQLINSIVTMINDTLSPNTDVTISSGTTLTVSAGTNYNMLADDVKAQLAGEPLDNKGNLISDATFTLAGDMQIVALDKDNCGYAFDKTVGNELFSRTNTQSRYTELKATDGTVYYAYNPYNNFGSKGLYTVGKLEINQTVLDDPSKLPFWDSEGGGNREIANSIIEKWSTASMNLDPNNLTKKDYNDYYTGLVEVIANSGSVYEAVLENQRTVVDSIQGSRIAVTGVSSEEELANMIKFQNAYNANSRFINAIAEMIDTLVNRVGVR